MDMERRTFLTSVGLVSAAGVGGCLGSGSPNSTPTEPTEPPASSDPTDSGTSRSSPPSFPQRQVSLQRIDSRPTEYDIELDVNVTRAAITAEATAAVTTEFRNTGESESPQLGFDNLYSLSPVTADYRLSAPDEIILYGEDIPWGQPTRTDSCWETQNAGGPGDGGAGEPPLTLKPGETLSRTYRVWDALPSTECLPPGRYHYGVRDDVEEMETSFSWMFTLALTSTS